ncbi:probable protein REVEILLE 8 at C-terminar half [Coccomyxa sp. Obi]|nr:probable protein REVEILLE 8 at C-terminar half [Coccomyxa sp. Obi]
MLTKSLTIATEQNERSVITFSVNVCRYKESLVQELGLGDTQTSIIYDMTSPRSIQCEAASLSTEESEARPRYLQTPSPTPQPFLEVNQYLNDDFLSCMDPLPEFGLEDAIPPPVGLQGSFQWPAGQENVMQQGSSTSGWPDEVERPRVPSPLSLEFPDFSDILGMEPLAMEHARPSGSYSGAKQEHLSPSPSFLSQQDLRASRNTLVQDSVGESAATEYHMRALSPGLSPARVPELLPPAAPYSPLLAHPVTPHSALRRPNAGHSPSYASQPLIVPAQPHNHPDFATIYAFLGSLFDPVRSKSVLVMFNVSKTYFADTVPLLLPNNDNHPDFATIYAFLGSLFDPELAHIDHADVLAQMAPVDRETACLLMNNMAANIADPAALAAQVEAAGAMGPPPRQPAEMVPPMYPKDPPAAQCVHVPAPAQHLQQWGSIPVYAIPHSF